MERLTVVPFRESEQKCVEFLRKHEDACCLLAGNLEQHGPIALDSHPYLHSGNFRAIVDGRGEVVSVFCLLRAGNLLLKSVPGIACEEVVLRSCLTEDVPITGILGDHDSSEPLYRLLLSRQVWVSARTCQREALFVWECGKVDPVEGGVAVSRLLVEEDFPRFFPTRREYFEELRIFGQLSEEDRCQCG